MKRATVILFLLCGTLGHAQQYYDDAQLWLSIFLEKKVTKNFFVHFNQQNRWVQNISQFGLAYADLGVTYKINKNIKVAGDYVFGQKRKNDGFRTRHQFYVALFLKTEIKKWRLMYRNRLQLQYYDPYTSSDGTTPFIYDRNKITVKYAATKRFEPYISEELYLPLNNPQLRGFQRSRSFAGLIYNLTKDMQFDFYFGFQAQLANGDWFKQKKSYDNSLLERNFIYGIGYSFSF